VYSLIPISAFKSVNTLTTSNLALWLSKELHQLLAVLALWPGLSPPDEDDQLGSVDQRAHTLLMLKFFTRLGGCGTCQQELRESGATSYITEVPCTMPHISGDKVCLPLKYRRRLFPGKIQHFNQSTHIY
jgi:hypothetical protein